MTMSKNEGIEKDYNDKDKQYQKREDMIFSFFRKLRKIEFWTYIAYVIVLTICFQSVMVMVLTLLFLKHFRTLWLICDLISIYYLSVKNWPCYLWIEIFDKYINDLLLRLIKVLLRKFWYVTRDFFWLKSKTTYL